MITDRHQQEIPISILLPFLNEGAWLAEAIDSILRQTFVSFELILIDNGADATTRKFAAASTEDPRVRILHEKEKGIAHALNTGLKASRGRYILRMDADDIAAPDRLARQFELLESDQGLGVVSSRTEVFPLTEDNEGIRRFVEWQNSILTPEQHALARFIESPVAHPSVMMRKVLFDRYGHYSTDPLPEDYELWLRWMKEGVRFRKFDGILLHWRDHSSRLTRSHPHYSEQAFLHTKSGYLAEWLKSNCKGRSIIVCGSSSHIRKKIKSLEDAGIRIDAVTDIKEHPSNRLPFLPAERLKERDDLFIINLIARSDLRDPIRDFLVSSGKTEGIDFIMAG